MFGVSVGSPAKVTCDTEGLSINAIRFLHSLLERKRMIVNFNPCQRHVFLYSLLSCQTLSQTFL